MVSMGIDHSNPYIHSTTVLCDIIWFSMGIDHSNPYIHNTTVLCDIVVVFMCCSRMCTSTGPQSIVKVNIYTRAGSGELWCRERGH